MIKQLENYIPDHTKANLMFKAFAIAKVPLLAISGAHVTSIDNSQCSVRIPFSKRNKNHLGSLYFGVLAIGADACVGLLAFNKIRQRNEKISLVFKSFNAEFLKRAEGPTDFICDEGEALDQLIEQVLTSGERQHQKIKARAVVQGETVAEFVLEISLKKKS